MTNEVFLPPGVAIGILAFLLSLLPAGLFIWLMYLRRHERPVPPTTVAMGFLGGMLIVLPAFWLERQAPMIWANLSPGTVHYYDGAIPPLLSLHDLFWPAVGTFVVVSLVEEGLRFFMLLAWFRWSRAINQIFDGLVVGLAAGLGFATLENTLYFFQLFSQGLFDALVFVFFLRFLISTLAHISFGGIMGALVARGWFSIYGRWKVIAAAFILPWFMHGFYDWLLGVQQTMYAVLLLLAPLLVLVVWSNRRDFFAIHRVNGKMLVSERPPESYEGNLRARSIMKFENPWNLSSWLTRTNQSAQAGKMERRR